jgi:hypothetical protein
MQEYRSANRTATDQECLAFIKAAQTALRSPPPAAQDALPFSLKANDQLFEFTGPHVSPADMTDKGDQMPNSNGSMAPRGGPTNGCVNGDDFMSTLPSARRNGRRDQAPPTNLSSPGAYTANLDQGDPDHGEMTGAELHSIMQLCRSRLSPDEQNNFDMLNRMSHNGNGGDRGMRKGTGGRDQAPPSQPSLPRPGGSNTTLDRRRAQDRRIAQDAAQALNTSSFLKRFPEARGIKFSANGRY